MGLRLVWELLDLSWSQLPASIRPSRAACCTYSAWSSRILCLVLAASFAQHAYQQSGLCLQHLLHLQAHSHPSSSAMPRPRHWDVGGAYLRAPTPPAVLQLPLSRCMSGPAPIWRTRSLGPIRQTVWVQARLSRENLGVRRSLEASMQIADQQDCLTTDSATLSQELNAAPACC